ncbi:hypothetical protein [Flavobacterium marginilacus]|uniref:hypothetical protein n=1 Tax=Flavobacterium marginilacus TaxID=3003256 RepID=UPI00248E3E76|nr:hypothetical protein [Flavobacterium marginilacus]
MKQLILISVLFLTSLETFSQDCPCNKALETNTQNEFTTQTGRDFKQATTTFFSQDYTFWENYSSYQNKTTDLDAGFSIFSSSFSDNMTKEEKKAKFENMKSTFQATNNISQNDYLFISQKIASETVYNTWIKCVEVQCSNQDRMVISYTISGDMINVTLKWYAKTNQRYTKIGTIQPLNAEYQSGDLCQYYNIKSQNALTSTYKRINANQDVVITVNVKDYDALQVVIPRVEVENNSSGMPVGTIVTSVLDYPTFCKLNNQSEVLNLKKSKWAPCDGRSVAGSDYANYDAVVPDLRGVFLRGLNDFKVPLAPSINPQQADPDPDVKGNPRKEKSFQNDAIQTHTHNFNTGGWYNNGNKGSGIGYVGVNWDQGRTTTGPTGNVSEKETRPKNVAVYYYIRINK